MLCAPWQSYTIFCDWRTILAKSSLDTRTWSPMLSLHCNSHNRQGFLCIFSSAQLHVHPSIHSFISSFTHVFTLSTPWVQLHCSTCGPALQETAALKTGSPKKNSCCGFILACILMKLSEIVGHWINFHKICEIMCVV